ncbi:MAG: ISAs1 family transposase [Synergistaceae bacterium]|nr:ISAs1 family transposase [Synergistaceae bacterium]
MPKINRTIAAIKQVLQAGEILPEFGKRTTKKATQYLLKLFSNLDDSRMQGMIIYPLNYIILIAFLAILGGADTWQEIHDFGQEKRNWLKKFLDVKKLGIPSHDTFCRVFGLINHLQLQERVVDALRNNLELIKRSLHIDNSNDEYRHLCIDGKEENGTGRKYQSSRKSEIKNLQTLHVFDSSSQICLFSQEIDEKTNEIPVAQEILQTIDLTNTICTFDSMHMQRKTIEIIHNNHGHYVGGLKGNQAGLQEVAASCFPKELLTKMRKSRKRKNPVYINEYESSHGKWVVSWDYFLVPVPENEQTGKWAGLSSFVMCQKYICPKNLHDEESTTETRFYATDLTDLTLIAEAIRSHWLVEQFHWQLDMSFSEDDNSTMNRNAFENLSLLIKLCLHLFILMKDVKKGVSVKRMRKMAAWNFEQTLEEMLRYFNIEMITQTLENVKI